MDTPGAPYGSIMQGMIEATRFTIATTEIQPTVVVVVNLTTKQFKIVTRASVFTAEIFDEEVNKISKIIGATAFLSVGEQYIIWDNIQPDYLGQHKSTIICFTIQTPDYLWAGQATIYLKNGERAFDDVHWEKIGRAHGNFSQFN